MPTNTLRRPPPVDAEKSEMENVLELTQLTLIDPNLYTNTRPLWHPPGARGIYGGAVIAQCLAVAQLTVPSSFMVHSMHCYFVLAGNSDLPVIYHVERVRDGRSFCTRTVRARQDAQTIFTTTMSFTRQEAQNANGSKPAPRFIQHAAQMPPELIGNTPDICEPERRKKDGGDRDNQATIVQRTNVDNQKSRIEIRSLTTTGYTESMLDSPNATNGLRPYETKLIHLPVNSPLRSAQPQDKRARIWIKARGLISPAGGHQAHLSALAYMSDSHFLFAICRIHGIYKFSPGTQRRQKPSIDEDDLRRDLEAAKQESPSSSLPIAKPENEHNRNLTVPKQIDRRQTMTTAPPSTTSGSPSNSPTIGMMVSLDHTIYFHNPTAFRADQWMYAESHSPWTDQGRGLVIQHIFTADGCLIATCIQEGLVRLNQDQTINTSSGNDDACTAGGRESKI